MNVKTKHTWERRQTTKRIWVARVDRDDQTRQFYKHTHNAEVLVSQVTGDFEVVIDLDAIVAYAARCAAHTKAGRSSQYHGMIKSKRLTLQVVKETTIKTPISEGYSEVPASEGVAEA